MYGLERNMPMTWLRESMSPSFFKAMAEEPDAIAILEREVETLKFNQNLILADRPGTLILATRSLPGSLYEGVIRRAGVERPISYAMFAHSTTHMPGMGQSLEIQRFEFECKTEAQVLAALAEGVTIPEDVRDAVKDALASEPGFDMARVRSPAVDSVDQSRRVRSRVARRKRPRGPADAPSLRGSERTVFRPRRRWAKGPTRRACCLRPRTLRTRAIWRRSWRFCIASISAFEGPMSSTSRRACGRMRCST